MIIKLEIGKLKTQSSIYCIKDNWERRLNQRYSNMHIGHVYWHAFVRHIKLFSGEIRAPGDTTLRHIRLKFLKDFLCFFFFRVTDDQN